MFLILEYYPEAANQSAEEDTVPYMRNFDLLVPNNAVYIKPDEILPGLRLHLRTVGIENPERYEHYHIRIVIHPRFPSEDDAEDSFMSLFSKGDKKMSRKSKRRTFNCVDSVYISLTTPDKRIVMREVFPPTTNRDGQPELAFGATISAGAGGEISGAKANAEIHAKISKEFKFRDFTVVSQKGDRIAIWDFRKSWFEDGRQPDMCLTCSIPKDLTADLRFVRCQRRVIADGRAVLAPKRSKKITLTI